MISFLDTDSDTCFVHIVKSSGGPVVPLGSVSWPVELTFCGQRSPIHKRVGHFAGVKIMTVALIHLATMTKMVTLVVVVVTRLSQVETTLGQPGHGVNLDSIASQSTYKCVTVFLLFIGCCLLQTGAALCLLQTASCLCGSIDSLCLLVFCLSAFLHA